MLAHISVTIATIYFLLLGSVTLLSGLSVNVYESTSVTLYCHIQPFDSDKCHRWYKELSNGGRQVSNVPAMFNLYIR